jgi:hypothetical protein
MHSNVDCNIHLDPRILSLSADARQVYQLLFTYPGLNLTGQFPVELNLLSVYTGRSKTKVQKALNELVENGLIMRDESSQIIFIPDYLKSQLCTQKHELPSGDDKRIAAIRRITRTQKAWPFWNKFYELYSIFVTKTP